MNQRQRFGQRCVLFLVMATALVASAAGLKSPSALAFSNDGGLWIGNYNANTLVKFSATQLLTGGNLEPVTTVDGSRVLRGPQGLLFDAEGNLWVTNNESDSITRLSAPQLLQGGAVTQAFTLRHPSLQNPTEMTWDAQGNLWVSSFASNQVLRFDRSQLQSGGTVAPSASLSASDGSLRQAGGLAFDGNGRLWVVSYGGGALLRFSAAQVNAGGILVPEVVLRVPKPTSVAFARNGDLYVSSYELGALYRLTPDQLEKSGAVTPATTRSGLSLPATLAVRDETVWVAVSGDGVVAGFRLGTLEPSVVLR